LSLYYESLHFYDLFNLMSSKISFNFKIRQKISTNILFWNSNHLDWICMWIRRIYQTSNEDRGEYIILFLTNMRGRTGKEIGNKIFIHALPFCHAYSESSFIHLFVLNITNLDMIKISFSLLLIWFLFLF